CVCHRAWLDPRNEVIPCADIGLVAWVGAFLETCMEIAHTRLQQIWLDDDGILHAVLEPGAEMHLDDAKESVAQLERLACGKRRPILVDMTHMRSMDREARLYFAGPATAKVEIAAALLVGSPLAKAVGNFFMGINK